MYININILNNYKFIVIFINCYDYFDAGKTVNV